MNSNLQDKLQQFSATPPSGMWDKIADALEDSTYAPRLFDYEEQPPATAWPQIEASLENTAPAKVIPLNRRFSTPMRYIAVASVITIFLVTITLTIRRTRAGDLDAENHSTATTTSPSSVQRPNPYATQITVGQSTKKVTTATKSDAPTGTTKLTSPALTATSANSGNNDRKAATVSARYLLYNGDDGKVVKVSKKVVSLLHCKDGDSDCQQRLKQLRQTMATNAMTSDFTGILEMLRQLQQKP